MKNNAKDEELDVLHRSRDFFQGVIDNIGDPTLVTDTDYHILFANKTLKKVFDGRDPVAEGLNCYQVIHHLDRPCPMVVRDAYPCPLREVISTKKPSKVLHLLRDSLDYDIFMEVVASPIFSETGEVAQVVESFRNITRYKQEEEKVEDLVFDLQNALAKAKRLAGLLPICMSCKRIRNDKGYWEKVETYIRDHSEAEFTHGLCPECEKSLYGELIPSLDEGKRTITDLMNSDHKSLRRILEDHISELDTGNMILTLQRFDESQVGLLKHILKEEEILFPAYEKKRGITDELLQAMKMEHREIKSLLGKIADLLSGGGMEDLSKRGVIKETGKHLLEYLKLHNQEEINTLYPLSDQMIQGKEKEELIRKLKMAA